MYLQTKNIKKYNVNVKLECIFMKKQQFFFQHGGYFFPVVKLPSKP